MYLFVTCFRYVLVHFRYDTHKASFTSSNRCTLSPNQINRVHYAYFIRGRVKPGSHCIMLCLFDFHVHINFRRRYFNVSSRSGESAVCRHWYYIHYIKQVSFCDLRSHDELEKQFCRHNALYSHYIDWLNTTCSVISVALYTMVSSSDMSFCC